MNRLAGVWVTGMPATNTKPARIKCQLCGTETKRVLPEGEDFLYRDTIVKELKKFKVKVVGYYAEKRGNVIVVKPGQELANFFNNEKP